MKTIWQYDWGVSIVFWTVYSEFLLEYYSCLNNIILFNILGILYTYVIFSTEYLSFVAMRKGDYSLNR